MCVALIAPASLLLAADKPAATTDGYRMVPIKNGNGTTYIRVKDVDPYRNVKTGMTPDNYDPAHLNFARTSSLANKSFSSSNDSVSKNKTASEESDQRTFITKSYTGDNTSTATSSLPNLTKTFNTKASSDFQRNSPGFDKTFPVSGVDGESNKAAQLASHASEDQNRTANLGTGKTDVFASTTLAPRQYLGPGAQKVPEGIDIKENIVLSRMTGLPNRPLSVDEVRKLINHETIPNTDAPPAPPSKPLNDPDYKPEPSPAPPATDDDKNDLVPPPGTISAPKPPENQEPLPH
jgi:hypothetical protein